MGSLPQSDDREIQNCFSKFVWQFMLREHHMLLQPHIFGAILNRDACHASLMRHGRQAGLSWASDYSLETSSASSPVTESANTVSASGGSGSVTYHEETGNQSTLPTEQMDPIEEAVSTSATKPRKEIHGLQVHELEDFGGEVFDIIG